MHQSKKCCGKVPVQNMGGVILDIDRTVLDSMSIWQDRCEIPCESAD